MKFIKIAILFFVSAFYLFAQESAGSEASRPIRKIIDLPTPGTPKSGDLAFDFDILTGVNFISRLELGIFNNFSIGASFGIENFIGSGKINFYKIPGLNAKYRIFTETRRFPSIALGIETQGMGNYLDSLSRYEVKSPGLFLALSKNFKLLGYFSLYGVFGYSLENKLEDDFNIEIGFEKTIWKMISFVFEYNFALNDNSSNSLGKGRGYMNMGIMCSLSNKVTLSFHLRNLMDNNKISQNSERALSIIYYSSLF